MTKPAIAEEVIERLLLARGLLDGIRYTPVPERDRIALAAQQRSPFLTLDLDECARMNNGGVLRFAARVS